mgnify:CR=1 FL=1
MAATATYTCRCGKDFTARTADRNRGWARFCSKRCKAVEQESRTGQHRAFLARTEVDEGLEGLEAGWDGHKNVF